MHGTFDAFIASHVIEPCTHFERTDVVTCTMTSATAVTTTTNDWEWMNFEASSIGRASSEGRLPLFEARHRQRLASGQDVTRFCSEAGKNRRLGLGLVKLRHQLEVRRGAGCDFRNAHGLFEKADRKICGEGRQLKPNGRRHEASLFQKGLGTESHNHNCQVSPRATVRGVQEVFPMSVFIRLKLYTLYLGALPGQAQNLVIREENLVRSAAAREWRGNHQRFIEVMQHCTNYLGYRSECQRPQVLQRLPGVGTRCWWSASWLFKPYLRSMGFFKTLECGKTGRQRSRSRYRRSPIGVRGERESGKERRPASFGLVGKRGDESAEVELKTFRLDLEAKTLVLEERVPLLEASSSPCKSTPMARGFSSSRSSPSWLMRQRIISQFIF